MKQLENQLMEDKTIAVKIQNKEHYVDKCMEFIENIKDQFCRSSALIMLNSDCTYLDELRLKYSDLIAKNKNKKKDIELNNMIDKIKHEESVDDDEEMSLKNFETYEAPKTFKQHLVMRANQ